MTVVGYALLILRSILEHRSIARTECFPPVTIICHAYITIQDMVCVLGRCFVGPASGHDCNIVPFAGAFLLEDTLSNGDEVGMGSISTYELVIAFCKLGLSVSLIQLRLYAESEIIHQEAYCILFELQQSLSAHGLYLGDPARDLGQEKCPSHNIALFFIEGVDWNRNEPSHVKKRCELNLNKVLEYY